MVKTYCDVGWLSIIEDLFQRVDKTKHSTGIKTFAVDPRIAEESIVSPEDQGIGIE
jgi:hypothetical protein